MSAVAARSLRRRSYGDLTRFVLDLSGLRPWRRLIIVLCLGFLAACGHHYAPAPLESSGFMLEQGLAQDFANPESVCVTLEPGERRPFLGPEQRRLDGVPACDRSRPTVHIAFFVLPTGCYPSPCRSPLSGYAVLTVGETCDHHSQVTWHADGGQTPEEIREAFRRELLDFFSSSSVHNAALYTRSNETAAPLTE